MKRTSDPAAGNCKTWLKRIATGTALVAIALGVALVQTLTLLYSFAGAADAGEPQAGLVKDAPGNL